MQIPFAETIDRAKKCVVGTRFSSSNRHQARDCGSVA